MTTRTNPVGLLNDGGAILTLVDDPGYLCDWGRENRCRAVAEFLWVQPAGEAHLCRVHALAAGEFVGWVKTATRPVRETSTFSEDANSKE